jgi:hypothetical protein
VDLVLEEADSLPPHLAQRLLVVQRNAERLLELVADVAMGSAA